jgi:hypothetical protein
VEPVGEVLVPAGEALEVLDVAGEVRQAGVGPLADRGQQRGQGRRQRHLGGLELLVEAADRVGEVDLGGPELEQGVDERTELPCLHQ